MGCDCRVYGAVIFPKAKCGGKGKANKVKTEYVSMTEEDIDEEAISRAGQIIQKGGLVAFPTETVYGLGGDAWNRESSRRIYAAKGRPQDNPLIVHIAKKEDAGKVSVGFPERAMNLADAFWPGPLTMILKKNRDLPNETTGGLDTVAVRFPSHKIAQALIRAGGGFIAAPSANRSGRPSPTEAKYCREDLDGKVDMIIDGGPVGIGVESTIVDLTQDVPVILRPGAITKEMLEEVLGKVEVDRTILVADSKEKPKAPGMKYRHYAPKGDLTIVEGKQENVISYINRSLLEAKKKGLKTGVICTEETKGQYCADSIKSAGPRCDEEKTAKELFRILREFDDEGCEEMYSESFSEEGIGMAVMNRLMKAAGQHVVHV